MKRFRLGITGLGAAARMIHLPAYAKLPNLKVVSGADPDARSEDFDFPVYSSTEEMLQRSTLDILAVVTPPSSHFDLTLLGLSAGCHVICEKPFMATMDEADAVISAAEQCDRWVVVNNQYRFMNIHRAARDVIGRDGFGDLLFVNVQQNFFRTEKTEIGWRSQDRYRTCREFGTHVFDLCRFFFQEDPSSITARMPKGQQPHGPDLLNLIQLEFSDDRVAQITLNRLCRGPHSYLQIQLDGTKGCLRTELGGGIDLQLGIRGGSRRPFVNWDASLGGRARLYDGDRFSKIASDPIDVFAHATRSLTGAFLDALEQGRVPPCCAQENRHTLELMLAAIESSNTGNKVLLRQGRIDRQKSN